MIAQLKPTASEGEVFLQTELSSSLLLRLPIHLRSDGTVGTATDIFLESDWPIPASLRMHVPTVKLCDDAIARKRQREIIAAWNPENQIKLALSLDGPHRLRNEILDALYSLPSDRELDPLLFLGLRKTAWLVSDNCSVTPEDVLTLPHAVEVEAISLLVGRGRLTLFTPSRNLAIDLRSHAGFRYLEARILPNPRESFVALAMMIEEAEIIGRIGSVTTYPLEDFAALADDGADLGLPGWPLLAAALTSLKSSRDEALKIVAAFAELKAQNCGLAAGHLNCLAALAEKTGQKGEAACRAYLHGFDAVSAWPEPLRQQVFSGSRVPNEDGGWRSGREVIADGDGVAWTHLLSRECAAMLRRSDLSAASQLTDGRVFDGPVAAGGSEGQPNGTSVEEVEAGSVIQQRAFLQAWRGRLPPDLVIIYLGLIGRYQALKAIADEWAVGASTEVDTLWADLDSRFPGRILHPNSLLYEVDQRRYVIEPIVGERVRATAMSGEVIDVPLGRTGDAIIVGNLHKTSRQIRAKDGSVKALITLPLRIGDLTEYRQKKASDIFRQFVEAIAFDCLWLEMPAQRAALRDILDTAIQIDQATLEETERLLRDRLPPVLASLKLPTAYRVQKALREYHQAEGHLHRLLAPAQDLEKLKSDLWKEVSAPESASELLFAVREKIKEFGYSASRVLFELFQNADDAYQQLDSTAVEARFRVEPLSEERGGFRVIHWGRTVNHLGSKASEGRRLGYDRDLLNMLLMNFSE